MTKESSKITNLKSNKTLIPIKLLYIYHFI